MKAERPSSFGEVLTFFLLVVYLVFEYVRPQALIPSLSLLHIPKISIGALGLLLLGSGRIKLKIPETKYFLAIILLMVFHGPIATNNYLAFWIFYGQVSYFIVYLSVIAFIKDVKKLNIYINIWIAINLFCAFVGIKNGGIVPNSAFMGDENDFALVMNMAVSFAYFMFLKTDSGKKKVLYLGAVCLFIAANVVSRSRGGFVGLIPVIAYCWYKTPKKIVATIAVVITVGAFLFVTNESYMNRLRSIKEENIERGTGEERWYSWKIGWYMFLDHPIIGVGQGNYPFRVSPYESSEGLHGRSRAGRAAHSIYFTLMPELGLVGIFLFSGMLYCMYRDRRCLLKLERNVNSSSMMPDQTSFVREFHDLNYIMLGVQGALLGYLVSGIFLSVLYYPHFWILIAITVAIRNVAEKKAGEFQAQVAEEINKSLILRQDLRKNEFNQ